MEVAQLLDNMHVADVFHADLITQSPAVVEVYRKPDESTYEYTSGERVVRLVIDDDADQNTVLCSLSGKTMTLTTVAYPSIFADVYGAVDKAVSWLR